MVKIPLARERRRMRNYGSSRRGGTCVIGVQEAAYTVHLKISFRLLVSTRGLHSLIILIEVIPAVKMLHFPGGSYIVLAM
jgi:hypothetical protein